MKKLATALILSSTLALSACDSPTVKQWFDPDRTFGTMPQPDVKGVNDTQEDMAKEAMKNGDYARAAEFYQQIVSSKKGSPEQMLRYKLGLSEAVRRLGKTENAQNLYDELYKENPNNLEIAEGRALTLMANGKTVDAGRAFSDILEKDPKRWRTLNALGILFVTKDMIPEAMAYYTEALSQSPDNSAVLNNVGLSQAIDKKYPRAIEALQQSVRVSKAPSQRKQIEMNLAMVYGVSGDLETAREVAGKYYEGAALDNNLGLYAHLAKDDALAKSYLNMALTQSPTYYERAWENLDVVNDTTRSDSTEPKPTTPAQPTADAKLPRTDVLKAPVAETKYGKSRKGGKATKQKAAEAVKPAVEAPSGDVKADSKPDEKTDIRPEDKAAEVKVESKAEADKEDAAAAKKPAGLVVGPGE